MELLRFFWRIKNVDFESQQRSITRPDILHPAPLTTVLASATSPGHASCGPFTRRAKRSVFLSVFSPCLSDPVNVPCSRARRQRAEKLAPCLLSFRSLQGEQFCLQFSSSATRLPDVTMKTRKKLKNPPQNSRKIWTAGSLNLKPFLLHHSSTGPNGFGEEEAEKRSSPLMPTLLYGTWWKPVPLTMKPLGSTLPIVMHCPSIARGAGGVSNKPLHPADFSPFPSLPDFEC